MNIAIIIDPLDELKIAKDSTVFMMQEAQARGHTLSVILQGDLSARDGRVEARSRPIRLLALTGNAPPNAWYQLDEARSVPLHAFDAVLMRKDPPFDLEYLYTTHLLEQAERQGARVYNAPGALHTYNEKLAILCFPEWTPTTLVSRDMAQLRDFAGEHGDIVVKPLDGMGGSGVFRIRPQDGNLGVILEMLTRHGQQTIMAQRFVPGIQDGDKRVLVVDGEVQPQVLARIPKAGETRGNLAAGGTGIAQPISTREREVAEALAPTLRADGLLLVGLDMIGGYLTEINVTSPTCLREIHDQTGLNIARRVIEALEHRHHPTEA